LSIEETDSIGRPSRRVNTQKLPGRRHRHLAAPRDISRFELDHLDHLLGRHELREA
jgi:hypothetical protein